MDASFSFQLRATLAGFEDNAFAVSLPSSYATGSLGGLLNEVFSEDSQAQGEIVSVLDLRANPDLSEIYDAFVNVFALWRRNYCMLHFFLDNGSEITLSQSLKGLSNLEVRIEQSFDVFATYQELGGDTNELMEWLRGNIVMYFLDKHAARIQVSEITEAEHRLSQAIADLQDRGFVGVNDATNTLEISQEGRQILGEVITETESYIDSFDVFRDVAFDLEDDSLEFGTGSGYDLRVQVYESEGLEPIRTVFLLRLYDGTLDDFVDDWRSRINDGEFFNEILRPVLDHQRVDESLIEWIIEGGYAHNEAEAQKAREQTRQERLIRRVQSE